MWKKFIIGTLVITTIFINSPIGYAAGNSYARRSASAKTISVQDNNKYQVISPEENVFATPDKIIAISGKAPRGTTVIIDAYGTTDMTRSNFNLENLPGEKDYIKRYSETIKIGSSGLFSKQMELILGVNKIVITFRNESDQVIDQKIIYVSDISQASKAANDIGNKKISDFME
ncbi:hypothetical protein [Sporanaerobacter acetigenes]|uniref:Uncharacterized protein n=1 Tax=Sporanaerobacter acetigenes DSM 13106 TaxID=1123281 RepID=A0A1M5YWI2_9FIRM|nr:hypothetical protein [Sporanaerobacter acetigenes]SHI16391.1 hypothetical protein SAMN02745180_02518 [Sporanaerobacter acetigenes DSM 13106]